MKLRHALLLSMLLIIYSCSTKKNTWIHRSYHSTTAYYNGYFNGREILKEAVANLEASITEDYYRILPVYPIGTIENTKTIIPDADKALGKASFVIKKHSIYIKGKEHNKFIDDAYLLLGQSYFYKRDYYTALEMFNYVAKEYIKNNKRDYISHKARAWLARSYNELGMFDDARAVLDLSLNDKALKRRAKSIIYAALTDFYLKQNNYEKALESVLVAISETRSKSFKRRLTFISGQLFQKTGQDAKASDMYKKVLKMTPQFEMAFYARINLARCYQAESGSSAEIRSLLMKMLKDQKNTDYADQIYYALGEIEEKEQYESKAIEQYNSSVRASTINPGQKGLSYLAIGNIYLHKREYLNAAAYYDSCISFLPKEHMDYKKVENKRNGLAELVKKYNTIALYDSLLKISNLSNEEIEKIIDNQILQDKKMLQKKIEEQKQRELIENQQQASGGKIPGAASMMGEGQWYFYNPTTRSFGFTEFRRVWGERTREDNWRRSNKQTIIPDQNTTEITPNDSISGDNTVRLTPEDSIAEVRKKYKALIPKDDKTKSSYRDSVTSAWYELGIIYKEKLQDLKEASEVFEEFIKKFPAHKYEPTVLYQLYRIYLSLQNSSKSEIPKKILLEKYPDSEYAGIIKNPDFFKTRQLTKQESDLFYGETYNLFKAGQYSQALNRCREAEIRYPGNPLMPKFALLKSLCYGNLKDIKSFRNSLEDVVRNYPGDEVKNKAKELLESLDKAQGVVIPDTVIKKKLLYHYRGDTLHHFVILFEDQAMDLNDFKTALNDFNNHYFSMDSLRISSRLIGEYHQLILVQSFANKIIADNYLKMLEAEDSIFADQDMNIIDIFIISAGNYIVLSKEQKIKEYLDFFKKVYQ